MRHLCPSKRLQVAVFLNVFFTLGCCLFLAPRSAYAQTLNGLLTGTVTDPSGAIVQDAEVTAVNQQTGATRTAASNNLGVWLIPQLPPATYRVSATKPGFATVVQGKVVLNVNQSVTVDFQLQVAQQTNTIEVTSASRLLNTTSATISTIVGHEQVVSLPLNGRQFTQLALLSPGAAPKGSAQQATFAIAQGAGGISPSMNGQRAQENNFTLDGIINNQLFDNAWAISPPPEAIAEFNVQSHMTNAQFGVSSGANINVQTRAGSNRFHGDIWEFIRNDALDANTYPNTRRQPYRQNQYGLFVGGPIVRDRAFFSGYWEGYRFTRASTILSNTFTAAQKAGDFSDYVGTTPNGTDSLGRPIYANELYDATTSRPDPLDSSKIIRDPFPAVSGGLPGHVLPTNLISPEAQLYLNAIYPAPNLSVAPGVFPNYQYTGTATRRGDQFGARFDYRFTNDDSAFVRLARNNIHAVNPGPFPTAPGSVIVNYAQEVQLAYTHIFDPKTILNLTAAYVYENLVSNSGLTNDPALTSAMGTQEVSIPRNGANVPIAAIIGNGINTVSNVFNPLGPSSFYQYNADFSKIMGRHTLGAGGMFFNLRQVADVVIAQVTSSPSGSSLNGEQSGQTGLGTASYVLGIVNQFYTYNLRQSLNLTVPWWAFYAQDQWQVNRKLVLSYGIRWDYVAPGNYHRQALTFDPITGKMWAVGNTFDVLPSFLPVNDPTLYHAGPGYFNPNRNGWQPRFGATYQFARNTVGHAAFVIFDQHDNKLTQGNENLALNWPNGDAQTISNLDIGVPQMYLDTLPHQADLMSTGNPSFGNAYPKSTPIAYVEEYNAGIQQQFGNNVSLDLDYVGSVGRHQWLYVTRGNTAMAPGPGPVQARAQYPQYGIFASYGSMGQTSYNGLQAKLTRRFAAGTSFMASYTWSKSMDIQSDPEGDVSPSWYNAKQSWGPSQFNIPQMFVFSGIYQLPFGKGRKYLNTGKRLLQETLGGWQASGIISLHSGLPQYAVAGVDIANTGQGFQPAQRGSLSPYQRSGGGGTLKHWLAAPTPNSGILPDSSTYAFTQPLPYTLGNERRNDLTGPDFKDFDFSLQKNFAITETVNFQFRSEFFNIINHTNYGSFSNSLQSPSTFGLITGSNGNGRTIQFSGKVSF